MEKNHRVVLENSSEQKLELTFDRIMDAKSVMLTALDSQDLIGMEFTRGEKEDG